MMRLQGRLLGPRTAPSWKMIQGLRKHEESVLNCELQSNSQPKTQGTCLQNTLCWVRSEQSFFQSFNAHVVTPLVFGNNCFCPNNHNFITPFQLGFNAFECRRIDQQSQGLASIFICTHRMPLFPLALET